MAVNRRPNRNDTWLTPPPLLRALGRFGLDPCCPPRMPWRTARRMVCLPEDGLAAEWRGRVWCNPPYSEPLGWIERMAAHGDGVMLLPAKSPETRWGQRLLGTADSVLFLKGRLLFHYADGRPSVGKWSPYLLAAYGRRNVQALRRLQGLGYPGVHMARVGA